MLGLLAKRTNPFSGRPSWFQITNLSTLLSRRTIFDKNRLKLIPERAETREGWDEGGEGRGEGGLRSIQEDQGLTGSISGGPRAYGIEKEVLRQAGLALGSGDRSTPLDGLHAIAVVGDDEREPAPP